MNLLVTNGTLSKTQSQTEKGEAIYEETTVAEGQPKRQFIIRDEKVYEYKNGVVGDFEYGECEYVENSEMIWPAITYGDENHWRNTKYSTFYCTHSLGPLIHITGLRPISVTGFEGTKTERNLRIGAKGGQFGMEIVTLENGGIIKSIHGNLYERSVWYSVYGSKGRMECPRELNDRKNINHIIVRADEVSGQYQQKNYAYEPKRKYENISDSMEIEIANYLNNVSEGRLSSESKLEIRGMLREVTEIESIGDSCYNLARTINRKRNGGMDFTEKQYEHIHQMMHLTDNALEQMVALVEDEYHVVDVNKTFNLENEINNYRAQLKNQNVVDVNNKEYDYQMGVHYMDLIGECEKLADYVVNVVEAHSNVKEKKAS